MAIFNVNSYHNNNILDVLDEAVYLNQETVLNAESIPIAESDELNGYLIRFTDLETISENYGLDYIDAAIAVCEANQINPENALIVVDEAELIVNPYLINELDHVIINPQPENSLAYQFCEACVEAWAETGDEGYLEIMLEDEAEDLMASYLSKNPHSSLKNPDTGKKIQKEPSKDQLDEYEQQTRALLRSGELGNNPSTLNYSLGGRVKEELQGAYGLSKRKLGQGVDWIKANPKYAGGAAAGAATVAGLGYLAHKKGLFNKAKTGAYHLAGKQTSEEKAQLAQLEKIKQEAANKPKSWLGKKIAALRSMYAKYQQKANEEKAAGKAGIFTKIASAILNCIDWLMNKLQHMAG